MSGNVYSPDKWVVVKFETYGKPHFFKVFACWGGGYTHGDSWKLSSGFDDSLTHKVDDDDNKIIINNFSGSVYRVPNSENLYGTTSYGAGVLSSLGEDAEDAECMMTVLDFDTAIKVLKV